MCREQLIHGTCLERLPESCTLPRAQSKEFKAVNIPDSIQDLSLGLERFKTWLEKSDEHILSYRHLAIEYSSQPTLGNCCRPAV